MLSGGGLSLLVLGIAPSGPGAMVGAVKLVNATPTVAQSMTINGNLPVTGKSASLSVLGSDDGGAANLVYDWSVAAAPVGGKATFALNASNGARNTTVSFTEAGAYTLSVKIVDQGGLSVTTTKTVTVTPTLTSVKVSTTAGQLVASGSTLAATSTSQLLVAQALDQFGNLLATQPTLSWSATSLPLNAAAPSFATSKGVTTITFRASGHYGLVARTSTTPALSSAVSVNVTLPNAAPTVAQAISVNGNAAVTGKTATLSVLGSDDAREANLVYNWSVTSSPAGGKATFALSGTNGAKNTTVSFSEAGSYALSMKIVDQGGLSVTTTKTVTVTPTAATLRVSTTAGQSIASNSMVESFSSSQSLVVQGVDQFGNVMATPPALTWLTTSLPLNAAAPSFATVNGVTTVSFAMWGYYGLAVRVSNAPSVSSYVTVDLEQSLKSIVLSPGTPSVLLGAAQQFTPEALDQFGQPMSNQQAFTWSASSGTITTAGLFTAPSKGSSCTVTAKSGTVTGTATVALLANTAALQDPALAKLVASLDADGSISRQDMIQILRSVAADGSVSAADFSDLKEILYQATALNIPAYVQALAGDVVNGSFANATFQGHALGNLAVGSSGAQLTTLIGKWFLGTDNPALCNTSLVYTNTAGSLFPHTPSHTDEYQGSLGDCYFISALGTLADSNPAAIQNMFINNGDGTYTVRFYTGTYGTIYNYSDGSIGAGFNNNVGTADYVTVNTMLPASPSGILVYADAGASCSNAANALWIPLAEKAYAQWNQTGKAGRDDLNAFASIQGGWMATVDAQVLGHNATDYIMTSTKEQTAINAIAAKEAVTIGTLSWSGTVDGLYASHAYAITGYNASNDTFTLYNPWGMDQPGQLTWSQLQATCSQMAVANTSGSVPMNAALSSASGAAAKNLLTAIASASRELFAILAGNEVGPSQPTRTGGPASGPLAASLVDAAFAANV